jgi:hypothetical protein
MSVRLLLLVIFSVLATAEIELSVELEKADNEIRNISRKFQKNERVYRQKVNRARVQIGKIMKSFNQSRVVAEKLKVFDETLTNYLNLKPFTLNDTESVHPKEICNRTRDEIDEFERVMEKMLQTKDKIEKSSQQMLSNLHELENLTKNLTGFDSLNAGIRNLISSCNMLKREAEKAAYDTSNVLISIKMDFHEHCGGQVIKFIHDDDTIFQKSVSKKSTTTSTTAILKRMGA